MLTSVIDPDSAVPPYEQVAKILRDEIAQGTMTGRIPSAHTIAEHHQVSHRVAARALEILQGEGMIENVPGEGHVVRHPRTYPRPGSAGPGEHHGRLRAGQRGGGKRVCQLSTAQRLIGGGKREH